MEIQENVSLLPLNTFGLDYKTRFYCEIHSIEDLKELRNSLVWRNQPSLVLGGGSNILLTQDFEGLVVKINILGKEIIQEDKSSVLLKIGAGENWHELVFWCLKKKYGGIENLSLIPGTVGAAPMQNIGAYGVEIRDVFQSLTAMDLSNGEIREFNNQQCKFGYRYSVFKGPLKNKYIISDVTLRLTKKDHHLNTSYYALADKFKDVESKNIDIKAISDAVIEIRKSKLPDPVIIGNSGSFFKNPIIESKKFNHILSKYENIPNYPADNGFVKIPAAWLIDTCGWKGFREGNIGVHDKQALVLVNHGGGDGTAIKNLALLIRKSVKEKFDIDLEPEVNIY